MIVWRSTAKERQRSRYWFGWFHVWWFHVWWWEIVFPFVNTASDGMAIIQRQLFLFRVFSFCMIGLWLLSERESMWFFRMEVTGRFGVKCQRKGRHDLTRLASSFSSSATIFLIFHELDSFDNNLIENLLLEVSNIWHEEIGVSPISFFHFLTESSEVAPLSQYITFFHAVDITCHTAT